MPVDADAAAAAAVGWENDPPHAVGNVDGSHDEPVVDRFEEAFGHLLDRPPRQCPRQELRLTNLIRARGPVEEGSDDDEDIDEEIEAFATARDIMGDTFTNPPAQAAEEEEGEVVLTARQLTAACKEGCRVKLITDKLHELDTKGNNIKAGITDFDRGSSSASSFVTACIHFNRFLQACTDHHLRSLCLKDESCQVGRDFESLAVCCFTRNLFDAFGLCLCQQSTTIEKHETVQRCFSAMCNGAKIFLEKEGKPALSFKTNFIRIGVRQFFLQKCQATGKPLSDSKHTPSDKEPHDFFRLCFVLQEQCPVLAEFAFCFDSLMCLAGRGHETGMLDFDNVNLVHVPEFGSVDKKVFLASLHRPKTSAMQDLHMCPHRSWVWMDWCFHFCHSLVLRGTSDESNAVFPNFHECTTQDKLDKARRKRATKATGFFKETFTNMLKKAEEADVFSETDLPSSKFTSHSGKKKGCNIGKECPWVQLASLIIRCGWTVSTMHTCFECHLQTPCDDQQAARGMAKWGGMGNIGRMEGGRPPLLTGVFHSTTQPRRE